MSNEKWPKRLFGGFVGDDILPSYVGIWDYNKAIRYYKYKDPHSTTSISMESTVPLCFFFNQHPRVSDGNIELFDDPGGSEPKKMTRKAVVTPDFKASEIAVKSEYPEYWSGCRKGG